MVGLLWTVEGSTLIACIFNCRNPHGASRWDVPSWPLHMIPVNRITLKNWKKDRHLDFAWIHSWPWHPRRQTQMLVPWRLLSRVREMRGASMILTTGRTRKKMMTAFRAVIGKSHLLPCSLHNDWIGREITEPTRFWICLAKWRSGREEQFH